MWYVLFVRCVQGSPIFWADASDPRVGIFTATAVFMIATLVALSVGYALTRHLPVMPLVSGVVVLVFVLQNLQRSDVSFLVWSGALPLGVALLVSAALGALGVFLLGSVRIVQLRRMTRGPASR